MNSRQADRPRVRVGVVRLAHAKGLSLPSYQSAGAAGLDLFAALDAHRPLTLAPGARALVPTGLRLELPVGFEGQVRPRSGLALNYGITVLNSPGTIDSDYRGEVGVVLANLGHAAFEIRRGDRVAQLIVVPVVSAMLVEMEEISQTERGAGGFGSTGREELKAKRARGNPDGKRTVDKGKSETRSGKKKASPAKPPSTARRKS